MKTSTFKISGMKCASCSMLIELSVSELVGVERVTASHADGLTTVTYNESGLTPDSIAGVIRQAGYETQILAQAPVTQRGN